MTSIQDFLWHPKSPPGTVANPGEISAYETPWTKLKDHMDEFTETLGHSNEANPNGQKLQWLEATATLPTMMMGAGEVLILGRQVLKNGLNTFIKNKLKSPKPPASQSTHPVYRKAEMSGLNAGQQEAVFALKSEINQIYAQNRAYVRGSEYDMFVHLHRLDSRVGAEFDAHGISKGTLTEQANQLVNLLTKGIDPSHPFHTAPIASQMGTHLGAAGGAYKDGFFMLVAKPGQSLTQGIHSVIVDESLATTIPHLEKIAPHVRFIRSSQAEIELSQQLAQAHKLTPGVKPQDLTLPEEAALSQSQAETGLLEAPSPPLAAPPAEINISF